MPEMLRIAVPNKGALSESAAAMLSKAGYRQRSDTKDLVLVDELNNVEFYYLRPRDIAVYVGEGTLDLGITGRDMLLDSGADAEEIMALGFGASKFRFAAPGDREWTVEALHGKRIATSYPGLLRSYLDERGISARLIQLDGAVESSIRLGVADAIADVVETGTTLRKAGLRLFGEPILLSEGILVQRPQARGQLETLALEHLKQRLSGVIVARDYVLMDYDIPAAQVDEASALTPGLESPTISPLAKQGWVAVRVMVPAKGHQLLMDHLHDLGAR
ncbi:MAG: ATP phosphoribosyltransferase, partial [Propionibacterium sp.]|nr:ATP phosphoribosyltransferase [Propionibacterium sp.]